VSGKHEPTSPTTFWVSLSTSVIRGALVVAAVVLGLFVASRAFPSSDETPTPPVVETNEEQTPKDQESQTQGGGNGQQQQQQQEPQDPAGVKVSVLNGTGITNLAACVAENVVEPLDYRVAKVDDATSDYEVTTISYRRAFEANARQLRQEAFPDAVLQAIGGGAVTDISIALGPDAAAGDCEDPA
jgi:hypothetical protein